ncbi:hypothetical protein [Flavobacterium sp. N502536]|uniref:hypothetical protein n=1 Tax=Flavobacterium sp. N502536 TaxID=2986837 RepID=UPI0022225145|nr:hypothetical protein [Flavobacterium sp. N502536]
MIKNLLCLLFIGICAASCANKDSSDLKRNYREKINEIKELKEYFNKIVPKNYIVRIRYNDSDEIDLFVYQPTNIPGKTELLFQEWNVDFEDYVASKKSSYYDGRTKSLEEVKKKLKWSNTTFNELYDKLENVNCIGITNGNPTKLEYGFRGMGVLSYLIFDSNLNEQEQKESSDDCSKMFYKDNVVFTFSSGAIGSFCIPDFKRK